MTVLLAGGTGLVGGLVLDRLLARGEAVVSVGRRRSGKSGTGLTELQVDVAQLPPLPAARAAICALGTTMATAGSRQAFRAVDQVAVLAFARAALRAGARQFVLVSAVGADPGAGAFYSRVKGEVEREVRGLGFARVDVIRPGLILGPRKERRPAEAVFQWLAPKIDFLLAGELSRFRSVSAGTVADAIVAILQEDEPGVFMHHYKELVQTSEIAGF
ncbi:Rossmann-fold NAD(P)-binding domain-containing protein [Sandaracinobacteroides hominis]|uniref:nucleoside-diphosphate sugar epimerase n=1 Tax=Sandaracinobacteroides hominis TaxID=2780086 RepID=UPI0018F63398|nr:nucleoside-diphosphate sugar epimerase [Sandaracinobacteroides hominis]